MTPPYPPRHVNPELDDILGALASWHIREILYQLEDAETDVMQLDELVDTRLDFDPDKTDREAIAATLHHTHLPKLDEMGWIDYDSRSETIGYRPETVPKALLSFLRTAESRT